MAPSIKRYVLVFLIGAVVVSSLTIGGTLLFSRAWSTPTSPKTAAALPNAFRPASQQSATATIGAGPSGQNLTDAVADLLAQQLVTLNPAGPQNQPNGNVGLLFPTSSALNAYLSKSPAQASLLVPSIENSRVQVANNFTIADVTHYLDTISQIENVLGSDPAWQQNGTAADGQTWITASAQSIAKAQDDLYAAKVPAPFVQFHKAFLSFFLTATSFSQLLAQDPVGAAALSSTLSDTLTQETITLNKANLDIQKNLPSILASLPPEESGSLAARLLGVRIAHAQIPVTDVAHIATTIAEWAEKFWKDYGELIKSYLLGILKNELLKKLSQKVIQWAQGEGVSGYVTNWLSFETNSLISANDATVYRASQQLCGNALSGGAYGQIIASALVIKPAVNQDASAIDWSTVGDAAACQAFDAAMGAGGYDGTFGWDNYLQSLQHNAWSDILTVSDAAQSVGAAQATAAVNEALAGQGYTSAQKCDDGSTPSGEVDYGRPLTDGENNLDLNIPPSPCADGSTPHIVTPGSNTKDITSKSVTYIYDLITGANNQDLKETLAAAVVDAVLSYLTKKGNGLYSGSGGSGTTTGGTTPPPTAGSTFASQASQYDNMLSEAIQNEEAAIASYQQTVEFLKGSLDFCSENVVGQVNDLITGFTQSISDLQAEDSRLQGLLDKVTALEANPASTLDQLHSQVGSFDSITTILARAKQDRADADKSTSQASDLVVSSCSPQSSPQ